MYIQSSLKLYLRIYKVYMHQYWHRFCIALISMAVAAITEPTFAALMKPLIDHGFSHANSIWIMLTPILIVFTFILRAISSYYNETISAQLSGTIVLHMRQQMFDKLIKMPLSYFNNSSSGQMISRILFDVTQVSAAGFNVITVSIRDGLTIVGLLALLVYTEWHLSLFCLFTLPLMLFVVRFLAKKLRQLTNNNQVYYAAMTQVLNEVIAGHKIVKIFAGANYENQRFLVNLIKIKDNSTQQAATASLNSGISQLLFSGSLAAILYYATAITHNNISPGKFVSFITALIMIAQPIKRIAGVTQSLQAGLAAAASVFAFLDEVNELETGIINNMDIKTNIIFNNVSFCYKNTGNGAVKNINLIITAGETVALVGTSGSGKTTLMHLLACFYRPDAGQILLDGINLNDFTLSCIRKNIALVSQDIVLFNDTIFNNVAYGENINRTAVEVYHAAELANLTEFISQLPAGFDTFIGENGAKLSGGQKQRIAIARAILKNAPILILDEATSALDAESEQLVQLALDRLMKNRTTIVIAHRLSTIQNANQIVVMQGGCIVESGSHEELLNKNNIYSNIYYAQFRIN